MRIDKTVLAAFIAVTIMTGLVYESYALPNGIWLLSGLFGLAFGMLILKAQIESGEMWASLSVMLIVLIFIIVKHTELQHTYADSVYEVSIRHVMNALVVAVAYSVAIRTGWPRPIAFEFFGKEEVAAKQPIGTRHKPMRLIVKHVPAKGKRKKQSSIPEPKRFKIAA